MLFTKCLRNGLIAIALLACSSVVAYGQRPFPTPRPGPTPTPAPVPAPKPGPKKASVCLAVQMETTPTPEEFKVLGNRLVTTVGSVSQHIYVLTFETTVDPRAMIPLIRQRLRMRFIEPNTRGGTITVTEDPTGTRISFLKADGKTVYKVVTPREDWVQTVLYRDNGKIHMVRNVYDDNKSREFEYFDKDGKRRQTRTFNRDGSMTVVVRNADGTHYKQCWVAGMSRMVYSAPESWILLSTELQTREGQVRICFKPQTEAMPKVDVVQILNTNGTVKDVLSEDDWVKKSGKDIPANLKNELGLSDDLSVPKPRESVINNIP